MVKKQLSSRDHGPGQPYFAWSRGKGQAYPHDPPDGNGNGDNIVIDLEDQDYSLLNTAGNAVVINKIIIANTGDDKFVALSSVCTHAGCQIGYNHSNGNFPCPCHGSIFAEDGSVVEGPASTAVKSYTITRDGNVLTIEL